MMILNLFRKGKIEPEEDIEKRVHKLLEDKEIILKALEANRKKFPEFKDLDKVVFEERQRDLRKLLKNIEKLKLLNEKLKNLEKEFLKDEFLKFEEKDLKLVGHLDKLLTEDEDEFKELIKFHDKKIKLDDKHKKILHDTKFRVNTDEKEKRDLLNLLYVMKYVHDDVLKLTGVIKEENKIIKDNSKVLKELKNASEKKITKIDDEWRFRTIFAVRELMTEVDKEIDLVKDLRNHLKFEEGKLGVVKKIEESAGVV